jgi:putative ABC transport system substrate-binding protein
MVPQATHFAALVDPKGPLSKSTLHDLATGAAGLGLQVEILEAGTAGEIDVALARLAEEPEAALLVSPDALFANRRAQIVSLAARHALPAIYSVREFTDIGGLMSYGPSFATAYHQVGVSTGRMLAGEKPSDLPVQQSTKFELVINLQTAKLLTLAGPPKLLAIADDVIE